MVYVRTARLTQADGGTWFLADGRGASGGEASWIVEDVAGWYGGSGIRGETVARLEHGAFVGRGWRENRSLTLHGTVLCVDSGVRDWQERNLSGMAWDGDFATLECDDGAAVLSTRVRLDGAPQVVKIGTTGLKFQLPLVADSPWLYSGWRESVLRPVGAGVGLVFPLFAPDGVLSFGSAVSDDVVVWNDGNAVSFPQFVVTADAPGGFTVSLGGARVSYPYPCFASSPVVVDMAGSVVAGGGDVSDRVTAVWGGVGPKEILQPGFELLSGGSGFCVVRHRDTYI